MKDLPLRKQLVLSFNSISDLITQKLKYKLLSLAILNSAISILDLFAVSLLGLVGALSLQGITSKGPGNRVEYVLNLLNLNNFTFQFQVGIIALIGATLFILKSILSMQISKRLYLTLSQFSVEVVMKSLKNWPLFYEKDLKISKEHFAQSAAGGASFLVLATLGIPLLIFGDLVTVLLLTILLILVDFKTAIFTLIFFIAVQIGRAHV